MNQEKNSGNTISDRRHEANRRNAQKSTGPRTEVGKARSAQNSYKHGLFSSRLNLDNIETYRYGEIEEGLKERYQPVGFTEGFLVERIASEMLRYARLLGHEQSTAASRGVVGAYAHFYESRSSTTLLRYLTSVHKQISQLFEQLEKEQARRRESEARSEDYGVEADDDQLSSDDLTAHAEAAPAVPDAVGLSLSGNRERLERTNGSVGDQQNEIEGDTNIENAGTNPPTEVAPTNPAITAVYRRPKQSK